MAMLEEVGKTPECLPLIAGVDRIGKQPHRFVRPIRVAAEHISFCDLRPVRRQLVERLTERSHVGAEPAEEHGHRPRVDLQLSFCRGIRQPSRCVSFTELLDRFCGTAVSYTHLTLPTILRV